MANRFFNDNWDEEPFSSRTPEQKLLYKFLWERSDIAGICKIHFPVASAYLGFPVTKESLANLVNDMNQKEKQIHLFDGDKVWFLGYPRKQQFPTKPESSLSTTGPHKTVVNLLKQNGLFDYANSLDPSLFKNYTGYSEPQPDPIPTPSEGYSNGNGSDNDSINGSGNGNSPSPYELSKSITERLNTTNYKNPHEAVIAISNLAKELEGKGELNPFEVIDYRLTELEEAYPKSEITIERLTSIFK